MKEVLAQVFGTPKSHRKSKPFVDHVLSFTVADNRVWIRNYQVPHPPPPLPEFQALAGCPAADKEAG